MVKLSLILNIKPRHLWRKTIILFASRKTYFLFIKLCRSVFPHERKLLSCSRLRVTTWFVKKATWLIPKCHLTL